MSLSSSSVVSEENSSTCTDKASPQTDMERMENPFRNLHPKIYYRQKKVPSRKLILDDKRELRMDFKTSPLLRVNLKTDRSTKHSNLSWPVKADDYSVISEKTVRRKGYDDFEEGRQNKKTIAYLNERNISLSKDVTERQKLALPLLVFPRAARENENLINTSFHPSSKSDKGLSFPPIKEVPSFIPLVREEERKRRKKMHKKVKDTQATRISDQDNDEYRRGSQGVSKVTHFSSANADNFNSRNHVTTPGLSARTYSSQDDFLILKAKIHRSSVL